MNENMHAVDPGRAEGPDTDQELDIPSNSSKLEDIHNAETIVQAQRADAHCRRIRIEMASCSRSMEKFILAPYDLMQLLRLNLLIP